MRIHEKSGCRDPGAAVSRAHAEAFPIEHLDDFGGENRLELLGVRVLVPKVVENISVPRTTTSFLSFISATHLFHSEP